MIIAHKKSFRANIKKVYFQPSRRRVYLLILQHNTTNQIYLVRARDRSDNRIYYQFDIRMPEGAEYGEYTWCLHTYEELMDYDVNANHVPSSVYWQRTYDYLLNKDHWLRCKGDRLANRVCLFPNYVMNKGDYLLNKGSYIILGNETEEAQFRIDIIQNGLLMYLNNNNQVTQYEEQKKYAEYDKTR